MSEEELIARLQDWPYQGETMAGEAADRIEALTEQLAAAQHDAKEAEAYAEELEKALTKAVQFTEGVIRHAGNSGDDYLAEQARATLAEIKGT